MPDPAASPVHPPEWAANAAIYELNVRHYAPEGTLRAVAEHLPRLAKMGVGIVWLRPGHPAGQAGHDYYALPPEPGTLADLRHLVETAHALGLRVLLHWAANHTSPDSALAQQHPDWYQSDAAAWNYANPELRHYLSETLAYWLREADIDGYYCEGATLIPPDFWDAVRPALEAVKPVFLLAECSEPPPASGHPQPLARAFDAVASPRLPRLLARVAAGTATLADLDACLAAERADYSPPVYLAHAVGPDAEHPGPLALPVAVLAALLPGMPLLHGGQEAGLTEPLPDPLDGNGYPLLDFYTRLLQLKKRHPALRNGDPGSQFQRLKGPAGLYGFVREKGSAAVLVVVNATAEPLTLPGQKTLINPQKGLFDVFSGEHLTLAQDKARTVPAHGWRVLRTRD